MPFEGSASTALRNCLLNETYTPFDLQSFINFCQRNLSAENVSFLRAVLSYKAIFLLKSRYHQTVHDLSDGVDMDAPPADVSPIRSSPGFESFKKRARRLSLANRHRAIDAALSIFHSYLLPESHQPLNLSSSVDSQLLLTFQKLVELQQSISVTHELTAKGGSRVDDQTSDSISKVMDDDIPPPSGTPLSMASSIIVPLSASTPRTTNLPPAKAINAPPQPRPSSTTQHMFHHQHLHRSEPAIRVNPSSPSLQARLVQQSSESSLHQQSPAPNPPRSPVHSVHNRASSVEFDEQPPIVHTYMNSAHGAHPDLNSPSRSSAGSQFVFAQTPRSLNIDPTMVSAISMASENEWVNTPELINLHSRAFDEIELHRVLSPPNPNIPLDQIFDAAFLQMSVGSHAFITFSCVHLSLSLQFSYGAN